jgi:hypothetical protein
MKNKVSAILAISLLIFVGLACSFSTANISSFNFGKNEKAEPPTTTFDINDKIYAVATVSNTSSKHKMNFKIIYENVEGKTKGEEAFKKDLDFEGARPVYLFFNAPIAGEYKVEATLFGEDGKELDKKTGTVTVKGDATKTSTETKKTDSDDDDK